MTNAAAGNFHERKPARRQSESAHPATPVAFSWWWFDRQYIKNKSATVTSAERVESLLRNHIVPFFKRIRLKDFNSLTWLEVDDFMLYLAGMDNPVQRPGLAPAGMYTMDEAAELGRCSVSKIKHLHRGGKLPGAISKVPAGGQRARVYIPAGDLIANGFDLTGTTPAPNKRRRARLEKSTAEEVLQTLRRVCKVARSLGLLDHDPTEGIEAKLPAGSSRKAREVVLGLPQARDVAKRLCIPFQVAMWLQRLMGLRVGEVMGLTLESLWCEKDPSTGEDIWLLSAIEQGGSRFKVRDEDGGVKRTRRKETKTLYGERTLVVPAVLAAFLNEYIDAFHREDDGNVDPNAPLIPGFTDFYANQKTTYASALYAASIQEGVKLVRNGKPGFTTHALRRSFAGELHHEGISEALRSTVIGHRPSVNGGSEVPVKHYTPSPTDLAARRQVAELTDRLVREQIGDLYAPTTQQPKLAPGHPLRDRAEIIAEIYRHHGYPIPGQVELDGEDYVDVATAAEYLQLSDNQVRQRIRQGQLAAVSRRDGRGVDCYYIARSVLEHAKYIDDTLWSTGRVSEELGISQYEVWRMASTGRIPATRDAATRQYRFEPDVIEQLRTIAERQIAIRGRSAPLTQVAHRLGLSKRAVRLLIDQGLLVRDEAPTGNGWIYITNESVESFEVDRARLAAVRLPGRRIDREGWILLTEAEAILGMSQSVILSLVASGVIRRMHIDGRVYVDADGVALISTSQMSKPRKAK